VTEIRKKVKMEIRFKNEKGSCYFATVEQPAQDAGDFAILCEVLDEPVPDIGGEFIIRYADDEELVPVEEFGKFVVNTDVFTSSLGDKFVEQTTLSNYLDEQFRLINTLTAAANLCPFAICRILGSLRRLYPEIIGRFTQLVVAEQVALLPLEERENPIYWLRAAKQCGMDLVHNRSKMEKSLKIGVCKGRHDIKDVATYVFKTEIPAELLVNPALLQKQARLAFQDLSPEITNVDLYVTGLTVAMIAAVNAIKLSSRAVTLYHYDRESGNYFPQDVI
jgi:hypothetical protein